MDARGFCFRCKEFRELDELSNVREVMTWIGAWVLRGQCPECGATVSIPDGRAQARREKRVC
jgi:hypothetical protein